MYSILYIIHTYIDIHSSCLYHTQFKHEIGNFERINNVRIICVFLSKSGRERFRKECNLFVLLFLRLLVDFTANVSLVYKPFGSIILAMNSRWINCQSDRFLLLVPGIRSAWNCIQREIVIWWKVAANEINSFVFNPDFTTSPSRI